ncbi:hypothetical protein EII34_15010 [Arachnia propionica]|uniref:Uncharacterized protein n=1 Tax=Arachnia propionica TaxID=1750 RepID=A0A3P1T1I1_9ACTN|nr:hypothetical protein [Arachnia propionica]RRD03214.1 hypothetical protein EII34_15010 [Arachnia propionica]
MTSQPVTLARITIEKVRNSDGTLGILLHNPMLIDQIDALGMLAAAQATLTRQLTHNDDSKEARQ